jgi:glyoxylase-like metal-dependent hydrolase (beta-lactamase superfamily II)
MLGFAFSGRQWVTVEQNLYLFRDCTNVYALVDGRNACLIGFGSGRVMDHLAEINVDQIELILVTHHHRDGLQGVERAVKTGSKIFIPEKEAPFIESAEKHWQEKRVFVNYEGASRFNAVTFNVPVARKVRGGDLVKWHGYEIKVIDTPGHTDGSLTFTLNIGAKKVAFTGDLYTAPGKTLTYFDLHWGYNPGAGLGEAITSAERLKNEAPMLVCPEHGNSFEETGAGLQSFLANLQNIRRILIPNSKAKNALKRHPLDPIGQHLVFVDDPTTYAIVSDSRHAILLDPGYCRHQLFQEFMKKYQIESLDAITFSHYHDDHVARTNEYLCTWGSGLRGPVRTKLWIFESMTDVLVHPDRYNVLCLFPASVRPDRIIKDGETVNWEGLDLTFRHFPGQTWYHDVILFQSDGHRYALTGDSVWEPADWTLPMNGPVIPRNRYFLDKGYEEVFRILLDYGVDTIVAGHYDPFSVSQADLKKSLEWARSIAPALRDLVDQPDPGYGLDPFWAHFYPYRVEAGDKRERSMVSLRVRNYLDRPVPLSATLVLPPGVQAKPQRASAVIPPKTESAVEFELEIQPQGGGRRRVLLADITMDGRYFGQVAEMLIDAPADLPSIGLR